jgi:hydrogenase nickel incorporation protein HypB
MNVKVVTRILEANDRIALENRKMFDSAGVFVINLMSGPGAGKTSLLERTLAGNTGLKIGVVEGDIAGTDDAERVQKFGAPVVTSSSSRMWGTLSARRNSRWEKT